MERNGQLSLVLPCMGNNVVWEVLQIALNYIIVFAISTYAYV